MRLIGFFILLIFSSKVMASVGGMCCIKDSREKEVKNQCPHHQPQENHQTNKSEDKEQKHQGCQKLCCLNIVTDMTMPKPSYHLGYSWQIDFEQQLHQPKKIIALLFRPPIA
jgi:hypothetical protein